MPTIGWKQIKQPAKFADFWNEEWDGSFTFHSPVPVGDGQQRNRRIYLEAFCGDVKIGWIEASTSIYVRNHDKMWHRTWKCFTGSKNYDRDVAVPGLDEMRQKVEDSFLNWCKKAGLS